MIRRTAAAAILMCAVMVMIAAAPLASADTHEVVKGARGPRASAVTWGYVPTDYGFWSGSIVNSGLRSLVVDVYDVTTGVPEEVMHQRIRFAAYPTNTVVTDEAMMAIGHSYSVTVTPNGPRGSSCTVVDMYRIAIPPVAVFTYGVMGPTVSADGTGSYDPDGTVNAWDWDWGDGSSGSGDMASHTYTATNTWTITLTVTDNDGLTDSTSKDVYVEVPFDSPPTASFTYSVSDLTVSVDATDSSDDNGIDLYSWTWGDGSSGSGMITSHTYAAYGDKTITLTVRDTIGQTDSQTQTVPVPEPTGRMVTYRISNMFELYTKSMNYADLGRWTGTMGWSPYWSLRTAYQEYILTNSFPFLYVYNPYSTRTTPDVNAGFVVTTWYRMYIDARNVDEIGTGPGEDPIFLPVLGSPSLPGGNVNIQWYSTYLNNQEMYDIRTTGTHYANTFYGVPTRSTPTPSADDGYWHELQGKITYDRGAAAKLLGIPGTGSLIDEFLAAEDVIEANWFDDWMNEGGGIYDIYTAYDYSDDMRWLELTVDPASTADSLTLRLWAMSWGNEVLLMRYMEAANVLKNWQAWPDDWYLNVTIGPTKGSVQSRATFGYHMTAWQDLTSPTKAAWNLEAVHMDWCGNDQLHTGYVSPYNAYDPDQTDVMKTSLLPGTTKFGQPVSYWLAPREWDILAGETLSIVLPSVSISGITPYTGTSDTLTTAKLDELRGKISTGTMNMGVGWPTDLGSYYDPATRTLTMVGPIDLATWINSYGLMETGAPTFVFTVG